MQQIGRFVRDVFEAQTHDERGDLMMEFLSYRPVSILLKNRGVDSGFTFTENITPFNMYSSQRAKSKSATADKLSEHTGFSSLARMPKTSSFHNPIALLGGDDWRFVYI